jgi:hypothetical protein
MTESNLPNPFDLPLSIEALALPAPVETGNDLNAYGFQFGPENRLVADTKALLNTAGASTAPPLSFVENSPTLPLAQPPMNPSPQTQTPEELAQAVKTLTAQMQLLLNRNSASLDPNPNPPSKAVALVEPEDEFLKSQARDLQEAWRKAGESQTVDPDQQRLNIIQLAEALGLVETLGQEAQDFIHSKEKSQTSTAPNLTAAEQDAIQKLGGTEVVEVQSLPTGAQVIVLGDKVIFYKKAETLSATPTPEQIQQAKTFLPKVPANEQLLSEALGLTLQKYSTAYPSEISKKFLNYQYLKNYQAKHGSSEGAYAT